ncbi:MAG: MYXO-CTERM domain-containing protein, partial [Phycisphaerales bacterium]
SGASGIPSYSTAYVPGGVGAYSGPGGYSYSSGYDAYFGTTAAIAIQGSNYAYAAALWQGDGTQGYSYALTLVSSFFQVSQDANLAVEFDFTATNGWGSFYLWEDDGLGFNGDVFTSFGTLIAAWAGSPPVGTGTIALEAGKDYAMLFGHFDLVNGTFLSALTDSSVSYIYAELQAVPAPGAAALLGLGGLVATRRRRS